MKVNTSVNKYCPLIGALALLSVLTIYNTEAVEAAEKSSVVLTKGKPSVFDGVLEATGTSIEINTAELRAAIADPSVNLLDARPYEEFAISHLPGAKSVPGKPGTTPALYVADVSYILKTIPDKNAKIVTYCNGLNCGRSKRFAEELLQAGYQNVRRYQLGAPGWRALGGVTQVEKDALLRLLEKDGTALLVDARDNASAKPQLCKATWIAAPDTAKAKDDGRLPMTDHNTRIFVVGDNGSQARAVAEGIVHAAFHNVSFFDGSVVDLSTLHGAEGHC